jgi:hypothetical protein
MTGNKEALSVLGPLLRSSDDPCPLILLGAGASFRSGVPTAADAVKQIARLVYSERELRDTRPPERVKPSEWESWLQGFDWFLPGAERLAENFPLVVEHLLVPAEFRKRVLLDLMRPVNGISTGYKILADFVLRGLINTMFTTNFDTCLPDALRQRQPHIRHIYEVNRGPGDYDQFNVYSKCQIIWLHGRAEQYSDKNSAGEIGALDAGLVSLIRPMLNGSPIIVVGYRGSEPSIMEGLFGQNKEGRLDFPNGVYWCTRHAESLHPNVEAFARRLGTNFRLLRIDGFDELFADLSKELAGHDRYAAAGLGGRTQHDVHAFDERVTQQAALDDLDLDLALSVLREYCQKLGRAPLTREMLLALMREQGLIVPNADNDKVTAGALLLFGKRTQDFFPHAVVSLTEAGKKREIYEGNLIAQHRALLQKLETADVNPQLKLKGRRQHTDQTLAGRLDSRSTAVDNQVIAEYITTLIRSQKERCGSNFLGTTKSANRNDGLEPLTSSIRLLFRSKLTINDRRFNNTRANEICTNLPVLQFCSPSAHVGAQRRLGGGVGAIARIALQPNTRPDKNHGATVIQDR